MKRWLWLCLLPLVMGSSTNGCGPLVGVVDSVAWNYGSIPSSEFPAYFDALKSAYGVNMAMLNLFPSVMVAGPVKQNYPNADPAAVDKVVAYLSAAKAAKLKVFILLSINCTVSDQTELANYHTLPPISTTGPYWPDCGAGGSPAQFASQAGQFYYNVISQVEAKAQQANVLQTIAAWSPQGTPDLGSSETRVDFDPYVPDITTVTAEAWPKGGRAGLWAQRPVTSWVIFGLPFLQQGGGLWGDPVHTYNNLLAVYRNAGQLGNVDYLSITYDSNGSDLDAAINATASLGLSPAKLILTDFKQINAQGLAAIQRIQPDMYWIWKYDGVDPATIKNFITQAAQ